MSTLSRADLATDITSKVYTNVRRLIKGNTVRDRMLNMLDSTLNKLDDADSNGGYMAINNVGMVDTSFIKSASPTGQFLRDDGTWQSVASGITASNGLTQSSGDIQLGGTLTSNTTIDGGGSLGMTIQGVSYFGASAINQLLFETNASGYTTTTNIGGGTITNSLTAPSGNNMTETMDSVSGTYTYNINNATTGSNISTGYYTLGFYDGFSWSFNNKWQLTMSNVAGLYYDDLIDGPLFQIGPNDGVMSLPRYAFAGPAGARHQLGIGPDGKVYDIGVSGLAEVLIAGNVTGGNSIYFDPGDAMYSNGSGNYIDLYAGGTNKVAIFAEDDVNIISDNTNVNVSGGYINLTPAGYGAVVVSGKFRSDHMDATTAGGTMYIGDVNASVINYGNSSTVHNFIGTAIYEMQVNSYVVDKLMTINSGGSISSGAGAGFEIEEAGIITGYFKTNSVRSGFLFRPPAASFDLDFRVGSFTANRTLIMPDASGTIALTSNLTAYVPYTGASSAVNFGSQTFSVQGVVNMGNAAANATSFGTVRIGQGTSFADFGELSAASFGIWANQATNSATNYSFLASTANTSLNGSTGVQLRIGGANRLTLTNTALTATVAMTAASFIRSGGTASQFMKADGSVDSNVYQIIYQKDAADGSITGVTTEAIIKTIFVPANTLTVGDVLRILTINKKTGTAGTCNIRIKVNTTNDLTGTPILAGVYSAGTTTVSYPFVRSLVVKNSTTNTQVVSTSIATVASDEATPSTTAVNVLSINWTVDQYVHITMQNSVVGDTSFVCLLTVAKI